MTGTGASGLMGRVQRHRLSLILGGLQIAFIIILALLGSSPSATDPRPDRPTGLSASAYNGFQDGHLGIVLGLGLLLVFLKRYAVSGIGFHLLLLALVLQWAIIVQQIFITRGQDFIKVNLESLSIMTGDFGALAVLVSLGAVIGKLSPIQLIVLALIEIIAVAFNHYIGSLVFYASDCGWAMYAHVFGAFFGLAVSRFTFQQHHVDHPQQDSTYPSDSLAILGTLVLWVCFPGLNSSLAPGNSGDLAVINTILALAGATVAIFATNIEQRFNVAQLQNGVLAGGVAIAATAHLILKPYAALLLGVIGGVVAHWGLRCVGPRLGGWKMSDTRGVLALHGLPGILAGLASFLVAGLFNVQAYGNSVYESFPAMVAVNASMAGENRALVSMVEAGELAWGSGRSGWIQGLFQLATLAVTIAIALIAGAATGFLLSLRCFHQLTAEEVFDDAAFWEVNKEGLPAFTVYVAPPAPEPKEEEAVELQPKDADEKKEEA